MAKSNIVALKSARLTDAEMNLLNDRVIDIRGAVDLALDVIISRSEESHRAIGVLSMAVRELKAVELMLDPISLRHVRESQAAEVANG